MIDPTRQLRSCTRGSRHHTLKFADDAIVWRYAEAREDLIKPLCEIAADLWFAGRVWPHSDTMKPPKRVARTAIVKLRITEADLLRWREAAAQDDTPLSDWIRRRCDGRSTTSPAPKKVPR